MSLETTNISSLPDDTLVLIFEYLTQIELYSVLLTNKTFFQLSQEESLWKFYCKKYKIVARAVQCGVLFSWKDTFRSGFWKFDFSEEFQDAYRDDFVLSSDNRTIQFVGKFGSRWKTIRGIPKIFNMQERTCFGVLIEKLQDPYLFRFGLTYSGFQYVPKGMVTR